MTVAALVAGAGVGTWRRINSEFQSFAVHISGKRFHVWKFLVGLYIAVGIAASFPCVVDVDVEISRFLHSITGHRVRNAAYSCVVHAARELVPTVPTYWRRACKAVVRHFMQRWKRIALR